MNTIIKKLARRLEKTWLGFFYDEPEIGNRSQHDFHALPGKRFMSMPWSDEMPKLLSAVLGKDYPRLLPLLWYDGSAAAKKSPDSVRYEYVNLITRLIENNYSRQMHLWCRAHGLMYIGHVLEDENSHGCLGCGCGHFFRVEHYQDMAGVDVISEQIIPGATSVNAVNGCSWVAAARFPSPFYITQRLSRAGRRCCFRIEPNSASLTAVEAAINEISESKINVHVNLLPISMGSYDQQVNLMIAGNEALDLMATFFVGSTAFNSMQAQNQCLPLNDLMDEYGTDIMALFDGDALNTCSLDGELMGVPIYKDNVSNVYFTMRTDILEQLGLKEKAESMATMSDIEAILTAVKENTDLTPLASSGTAGPLYFSEALFVDNAKTPAVFSRLANDYIGVLDTDPETIVSLYETQSYKDSAQLIKNWYDKGLIYKDSASSTDSNYTQIASGKFFGTFFIAQNATKIATIASCEYDMTTVLLCSLPLASSSYNTNTWVVPVASREPEAAVKFLNLMYTNKEVVDLLNYGMEGADYIVLEDGTYGYPEGMDSTSVGYHIEMTWLFGNQYLSGVWKGDDPNTRDISMELNKDALKSATFGFAPDISRFSTEIAAITSAINEYAGSLQNGLVDVDSTLEAFNAKLKAGGIDKVTASVQEQLDAWSKK